MRFFQTRFFSFSALLLASSLFLYSCDENRLRGPDFSQVPDPVSISGITPDTLANGTLIYITREGSDDFGPLTVRDSSYEGGFMDPVLVDVLTLQLGLGAQVFTGSYFRFVVAGMLPGAIDETDQPGEYRVALVPPSVTGLSDTLRYEIELFQIVD
jgi:hypothetical protein